MTDRMPAVVFPPGDTIKEELEERGWTQVTLAEIMGRSPKEIHDLITGKRPISLDMAKGLEDAFGPSALYWMNLDNAYRLWRSARPDDAVARRSRLYQLAPIKEMCKRHWLEWSESVSVLEQRVMQYFGLSQLDDEIRLPVAARTSAQGPPSPAQQAWFFRAKQLSRAVQVKAFSDKSFERGLTELRSLLLSAQEVRHVPRVLADAGIRFVVIEHLPHTKIDGAAFRLDAKSPVIALSLRYDRIDHFWFTLFHELRHIQRRDDQLDTDILEANGGSAEDEAEVDANRFAREFLIEQSVLDSFVSRTSPLYGKQRIIGFARTIGVHPGIVVGQLHFRKEIEYDTFRPMLEKVRNTVTQAALTDGWGQLPPVLT